MNLASIAIERTVMPNTPEPINVSEHTPPKSRGNATKIETTTPDGTPATVEIRGGHSVQTSDE
jgi:hypothetical protein